MKTILTILLLCIYLIYAQNCNDGTCDVGIETCLNCPEDCKSCLFFGMAFYSFAGLHVQADHLAIKTEQLSFPEITNWMPQREDYVSGIMKGYLKVEHSRKYHFQVKGNNVGGKLVVNGVDVLQFACQSNVETKTYGIHLKKDKVVKIEVHLYSTETGNRNVSIQWKPTDSNSWAPLDEIFYSQNICGDGIKDDTEDPNCDPFGVEFNDNSSCSEDECHILDVHSCFIGCYNQIASLCRAIPVPPGHISPGIPVRDDSLGSIIQNQFLWKLPGIEHMDNGFNIITGEESTVPLFSFGFCDDHINQTVQDTYRGNVYIIPDGLFAQPEPTCTYDVKSERFKSGFDISKSYAESAANSIDGNAGAKLFGFSMSFSAAFSKSKAVQTVNRLHSEKSGDIISSELVCKTSRVQIYEPKFHPIFLERLAKINSTTEKSAVEDIVSIMNQFGTHYYKKATLGGKLQQFTIVESSLSSNFSSSKLEEHAKLSFSASVSNPFFSASGGYGSSIDTSVSLEEQIQFEKNTTRSTILTFGGAPGSFGPSEYGSPSNFGDWARTIDLIPVPIEYELERIANIIHPSWTTANGSQILNLWKKAEKKFYEDQFLVVFDDNGYISEEGTDYVIQVNNTQVEYGGGRCWAYKAMHNDETLGMNELFVPFVANNDSIRISKLCNLNRNVTYEFVTRIELNKNIPYDVRNTSLIIDLNDNIASDIRSDLFNQTYNGIYILFDKKYSRIMQYSLAAGGKPLDLSPLKDYLVIQSFCKSLQNQTTMRIVVRGTLNFIEFSSDRLCPSNSTKKGVTIAVPLDYPIGIPLSITWNHMYSLYESNEKVSSIFQAFVFLHPCKVFPEQCSAGNDDVINYFLHAVGLEMIVPRYNLKAFEHLSFPLLPLRGVKMVKQFIAINSGAEVPLVE